MANEKFTQLPTVTNAALTDIIAAVQSGVSVQETLQQVFTLMLSNIILHNAGNPNGSVAGSVYQLCWDTTNNAMYVCTTSGNAATAVWKTSSGLPIALGAAGTIVRSNGTAPVYSTSTFADTYAINTILYNATANTVSGLATGNSGALVTSAGGVPSISTQLPGGMTIASDPTVALGIATKQYVDQTALNGTSVYAASASTLGTVTQSGAGVGATLTNAGAQATFALDGVNPPVGSNVLIKNTATGMTAANEGIYTVVSVGSGASNWQLVRATSYDTSTEINNTGLILVQNGSTLVGTAWYNSATIVTVDTTAFSYSQFGNITFPITLANGGTSASLTASNGGIFYSTASAGAIFAGTATAGLALLSGASTTPSWSAAPPITKVNVQVFTATGSQTYTPTTGMKFAIVEIIGAGASGGAVTGGTAGQSSAAGGGGGGGYCRKLYTSTLIGATGTVVIGTGGTAAPAGANNGVAGGASTFTCTGGGATLTAGGGTGGALMSKSAAAQRVSGGTAGTGTNGDINISGGVGGDGATLAAGALVLAGNGGGTFLSPSPNLIYAIAAGSGRSGGLAYGSGSSGAYDIATADFASSAGANGVCIITEYISV